MIGTTIYIEGVKLDLFDDETIELNSSAQNINDISKVFSDFSQSFTVPASDNNNAIFQHYYNIDVDGNFNPNIRSLSYIEIGSLPFRYGVMQLEDVKLKKLKPYCYTLRFYSSVVNLSDLFGDEELSGLDLSAFDHVYNVDILESLNRPTIADGDVYYPLISSVRNYEIGTANENDITTTDGEIVYTDLKPALRLIKIIEAIETKYSVSFSRSFFGRAVFRNLFMWMHREAGTLKAFGNEQVIDITGAGTIATAGASANTTDNSVTFVTQGAGILRRTVVSITPDAGFETVPYKLLIYNNGEETFSEERTGQSLFSYTPSVSPDPNVLVYKIVASGSFDFTPAISVLAWNYTDDPSTTDIGSVVTASQSITSSVVLADQMPKMKVRDFITSIIKMFNLVLVPTGSTSFDILPLDDWYAKGKLVDITKYVDTENITIKRPKLHKRLSFKHQKSEQILNERFRQNNGLELGYGDLQADYDIDGSELKIETQFENLMFERLQDRATGDITNVQVGKSIGLDLEPYIGKPYIFYRNGYVFHDPALKCDNFPDISHTWLTGTENDIILSQVYNTVNFSSDISTFLYSEIANNLFNNYWQDYISDLYSLKRRLTDISAQLPVGKMIDINLNDRIKIGDKAYVINTFKPKLNTGETKFELLNYIGLPFTSQNTNFPLTADTVDYSADTELLTADMNYLYIAQFSPYENGIAYDSLIVTPSYSEYDLKITANSPYDVIKVNTGDGVSWVNLENETGTATGYLLIKVDADYPATSTPQTRSMDLEVSIGADTFTVTITQTT